MDGRRVSLGTFDTAVEAAVAYARAVGEGANAEEAEGLRLHLSRYNSSGYKGVHEDSRTGRFSSQHWVEGRNASLGTFDTTW